MLPSGTLGGIEEEPRMGNDPLFRDLNDMEALISDLGRNVQITYRIRLQPAWMVRIQRKEQMVPDGIAPTDRAPRHSRPIVFRQGVGDTLNEAFEVAYDAWLHDREGSAPGRKRKPEIIRKKEALERFAKQRRKHT